MKPVFVGSILALAVIAAVAAQQQPRPATQGQTAKPPQGQTAKPAQGALRIVVLDGEDSVNIVQRKTAVRPVVEVRDRNDLPVAGATVQFTVAAVGRGGATTASFASGQTVTVTTNMVGQAFGPPMQALSPGAVQINVQATYQSQVAQAVMRQTNYATVADATQAGRTVSTPRQFQGEVTTTPASSLAGTVAGFAGAGLTAGLVVRNAVLDSGCTTSNNIFLTDLAAAGDLCTVDSSSPQCTTAASKAAASLGDWCSCEGGANVDAALMMIGTSLDQLEDAAALAGTGVPASCR
jgi:hypothetical protein